MTKRRRMSKTGVAGDALGQPNAVRDGQVLEELLSSFMRVEHPELQIEDRLACNAEEEVSRLNDARMNGADRHLKNTFTFDFPEFMPGTGKGRQPCAEVEIFA